MSTMPCGRSRLERAAVRQRLTVAGLEVDEAVGDAGLAGRADAPRVPAAAGRVVGEVQLDVGLAVVAQRDLLDGPDLAAGDLHLAALDEQAGVLEAGVDV